MNCSYLITVLIGDNENLCTTYSPPAARPPQEPNGGSALSGAGLPAGSCRLFTVEAARDSRLVNNFSGQEGVDGMFGNGWRLQETRK